MHELSVCLALMEQVRKIAREHKARAVERIVLRIGPLSGIEAPLLRNAFPIAASGTLADGAELQINHSDIVVRCTQCETESAVSPNKLICAACGDFRTRLVRGDEMILEQVELDIPSSGRETEGRSSEASPTASQVAG